MKGKLLTARQTLTIPLIISAVLKTSAARPDSTTDTNLVPSSANAWAREWHGSEGWKPHGLGVPSLPMFNLLALEIC